MITIPFKTPKASSANTYAKLKQELIPAALHGTVISLPLIFELSMDSSVFNSKPWGKFFEPISTQAISNIMHGPTPIGRCQLFPVHSSSTSQITYLPQLLQSNQFSFESDVSPFSDTQGRIGYRDEPKELENIAFPSIIFKSYGANRYNVRAYDFIDFKVYNNSSKKHGVPNIDTYSFANHLCTQIHTRYYRPNYIKDAHLTTFKTVLDTYLPFFAISSVSSSASSYTDNEPSKYSAISPLTADLLNIPRISINTILTKILRKDLSHINNLIKSIKKQKVTLIFAGTGGTGINTICWLTEICNLLGHSNIFSEIHVFEKDYVDFSNIFRFPLPLSAYITPQQGSLHKTELVRKPLTTLSDIIYYHDNFIESLNDIPSILLDGSVAQPNTVFYGAPSIANRNFLSSLGSFISATHANNTASLYANPIADDSLQVETYGLIQLNSFFINQISMAIGLLEMIATKTYIQPDFHYSDYTFVEAHRADYFFDISTDMQAIPIPEGN